MYVLFNIVSGLQFLNMFLSLPCFGMQVIVPCFMCSERESVFIASL